jgi:membrane protein DedA with SNARE-associated domain
MEFGHEIAQLESWIHQYGISAVFLILTFESFGIPLPGESLLIVASILCGRGDFSFFSLFFSALAGAVLGDNIGYLIGRMLGHDLLWRYGAKVGLDAKRLHKVEVIFARYGPLAVGLARFFNLLRQLNGIFAGTVKMNWWQFLIYNALGGALWVLTWITVGFYFGRHGADFALLADKVGLFGAIIALFVLVVVLAFVYRRRVLAILRRLMVAKTKG